MNCENKNELETNAITNDTNPESNKDKCNDIGKVWEKTCPKCGKKQVYTGKKARSNYNRSIRKNNICKECARNIIPVDKLIRRCPNCNIELKYKRRNSYSIACKYNTNCKKCSHSTPEICLVRICPLCNNQIIYKTKNSYNIALKKNSKCRSCVSKYISETTREKHRKSMTGKNNPSWNKVGYWKGKERPEIFKLQHRILVLKRKEDLGIPHTEDKGAREYFNKLNTSGFNFKPTRFMELGYEADGYDKEKHIWYEYDTPYHSKPSQQKDDLKRQTNIINYFKNTNNPLNEFVRVKVDEVGNIKEIIQIL